MRVCHVNLSKELRGGEHQTVSLVRVLRHRVDQRVVVRRESPLHACLDELELEGVEVVPVPNSPIAALRSTRGADLVHIHEGRSVPIGAARSLLGTPFVITRRVLKAPTSRPSTRWCYRRAEHVVSVSQAVGKVMTDYSPQTPVTTIYDCVATERKDVAEALIPGDFADRLVIGNVAELDDDTKGQRTILEVARRLETELPDVMFVLIGKGKDEAALRAESRDLSNVRFLGWSDQLADYYAAMDLFVFPSRTEALGSAVLEAMSFGVPVVASQVGGLPEVVHPGVNGFLVGAGDIDDWVSRVEQLCRDASLRVRLARNAAVTAAGFTPESIAEQYYSLYVNTVHGVNWAWPSISPTKTRSESL
ncbi:MAG TPA: glycosyltransferase family 4 protein [Gammaproteobacteria bacterium]